MSYPSSFWGPGKLVEIGSMAPRQFVDPEAEFCFFMDHAAGNDAYLLDLLRRIELGVETKVLF